MPDADSDVDAEQMTHHVGDDCPGGHQPRSPISELQKALAELDEASEAWREHALGPECTPRCEHYEAVQRAVRNVVYQARMEGVNATVVELLGGDRSQPIREVRPLLAARYKAARDAAPEANTSEGGPA